MTRRRNKSGDGDSLLTFLMLAGGAYLAYQWYLSGSGAYTSTVLTGTTANPVTVPGAPAPTVIADGPLSSAPQGPTDPNGAIPIVGNSGDPLGVAGFFQDAGMW